MEMYKLNLEALFQAICKQKDQIQESQGQEKDLEVMEVMQESHHQV